MATEETKPVEREATKQANDLLRRLNLEVFGDGIEVEKLPHAVGLLMDFAQASADAALERAAQIANEAGIVTFDEECFKVERAIRALKGSR